MKREVHPIRNDKDHDQALAEIERLWDSEAWNAGDRSARGVEHPGRGVRARTPSDRSPRPNRGDQVPNGATGARTARPREDRG